MRKKLLSVALCVAMAATALAGCGSSEGKDSGSNGNNGGASAEAGKVYFLNFKPEIADAYEELMAAYEKETGVDAKVVTAASNQYESTLRSELDKEEAPTLFTINGPMGYNTWKDYCMEMSGTEFYGLLADKSMVVKGENDGVYGVGLMMETYGLICNKAIFAKYFELADRADTGCSKIEDINTFAELKAVADDMQAKKDALGIKGVFSQVALNSDNNWRITNHLFDLPLYYEYTKDGVSDKNEIGFTYAEQFKNILDLYLTDSTVSKDAAGNGSVDDSMTEFAMGQAAIAQNGNWAWGQINIDGSVVKAEDLYYMPIYTGAEGEESQGLCTGTENFVTINAQASEADRKASDAFLKWLYTSETGMKFVAENYGVAPFTGFNNSAAADANPLTALMIADTENSATKTVNWVTVTTPSQDWKDALGANLKGYAEGTVEWDKVVKDAVDKWKAEKGA
jgi:raffinose/stachyose/melibiose transport system substrate-binding protein